MYFTGFDDLSLAELALIGGLASLAPVVVSLTWVAGRPAFEGVAKLALALAERADEHVVVEGGPGRYRGELLSGLERHLFESGAQSLRGLGLDARSLGVLRSAGPRAEVELVAAQIAQRVAAGVEPGAVAVVARGLSAYRGLVRQVFGEAGIPYDMEEAVPLAQVALGRAVLALARVAVGADRGELFRLALSSYGGLAPRRGAAFEAAVRRRGIADGRRAARALLGQIDPGDPLARWLSASVSRDPYGLLRLLEDAVGEMLVNAYGRWHPELDGAGRADAAAAAATREAVAELRRLLAREEPIDVADVVASLERVTVRVGHEGRPGHVQVLSAIRARERRFDTVAILGLTERSFPALAPEDPFFSVETRARLAAAGLTLPDPPGLPWERYLFYTAVTRARSRLVLSYQAASVDGKPLTRSFFIDDVETLFAPGDGAAPGCAAYGTDRAPPCAADRPLEAVTVTKGLAAPTFADPSRAPGTAEYRRAIAGALVREAHALGRYDIEHLRACGHAWLARAAARGAGDPLRLSGAAAAALAARRVFSATQLEAYARCPLRWFIEHELAPERLDRELGPLERGTVIHKVLAQIGPQLADDRFGVDHDYTVSVGRQAREVLDATLAREAGALEGLTVEQARRLAQRQLEAFLMMQAARRTVFRPTFFEQRFDETEPLALDDETAIRGTIDRVDVAPDGRAFILDYKSGKTVPNVKEMRDADHLQVRLYCLAWDALFSSHLGSERPAAPTGRAVAGGYWALGSAAVEGICDGGQVGPGELGLPQDGALSPEEWAEALQHARERALALASGIRRADIEPSRDGKACWRCEHEAWCGSWS